MILKKLLVILFLFFITSNVHADCPNTNLQVMENSPFQRIPVYDQNGLGSCYAYTASQMVDFYRLKSGYGKLGLTHPIWLALKFSEYYGYDSLETGNVKNAVNIIRERGVCRDDEVQKRLNQYKAESDLSDAELMNIIEQINSAWDTPGFTNIGQIFDKAVDESWSKNACFDQREVRTKIFSHFRLNNGRYRRVLAVSFLKEALASCKGDQVYRPVIPAVRDSCQDCSDREMNDLIDDQLKSGLPVAFSYCAKVLEEPSYRGISDDRNKDIYLWYRSNYLVDRETCGSHGSLVVGSRQNQGQCQYLVRNSWGSSSYEAHPNCLCEIEKGKYEDCQHGDGSPNVVGCWVNRSDLTPNVMSVTHF